MALGTTKAGVPITDPRLMELDAAIRDGKAEPRIRRRARELAPLVGSQGRKREIRRRRRLPEDEDLSRHTRPLPPIHRRAIYLTEMGHERTMEDALARCEREIAEIRARRDHSPTYLTVMGEMDWRHEARLIEREKREA